MNAFRFALLALPSLAAAAPCQAVTLQARAWTNLSAAAQAGSIRDSAVLPQGSPIDDGTAVVARANAANASTLVRVFREPNRIVFAITEYAVAVFQAAAAPQASTGAHEMLLSVQLAGGIRAKVQLEWTGRTYGLASFTPAEVDLFNDGVVDFVGSSSIATAEIRGFVGPRTLDIRVRTGTTASAPNGISYASGGLQVRILPDTGRTVDPILPGCGGQLTLEPTFDGDVDAVYAVPPGALSFLVGGLRAEPSTAPPLACLFLPRPNAIALLDPTRNRLPLGLSRVTLPRGPVYFQGLTLVASSGQAYPSTAWSVTSR